MTKQNGSKSANTEKDDRQSMSATTHYDGESLKVTFDSGKNQTQVRTFINLLSIAAKPFTKSLRRYERIVVGKYRLTPFLSSHIDFTVGS